MRKLIMWLMMLPDLIQFGDVVLKHWFLLVDEDPWTDHVGRPDESRGYDVPDDGMNLGRRLTANADPVNWSFSIPEAYAAVSRGDQFLLNLLPGPPSREH